MLLVTAKFPSMFVLQHSGAHVRLVPFESVAHELLVMWRSKRNTKLLMAQMAKNLAAGTPYGGNHPINVI